MFLVVRPPPPLFFTKHETPCDRSTTSHRRDHPLLRNWRTRRLLPENLLRKNLPPDLLAVSPRTRPLRFNRFWMGFCNATPKTRRRRSPLYRLDAGHARLRRLLRLRGKTLRPRMDRLRPRSPVRRPPRSRPLIQTPNQPLNQPLIQAGPLATFPTSKGYYH